MCDETPKIPADDTVPRCALLAVELALDVLRYIFLDRVFLHRFLRCGRVSAVALYMLAWIEALLQLERQTYRFV